MPLHVLQARCADPGVLSRLLAIVCDQVQGQACERIQPTRCPTSEISASNRYSGRRTEAVFGTVKVNFAATPTRARMHSCQAIFLPSRRFRTHVANKL